MVTVVPCVLVRLPVRLVRDLRKRPNLRVRPIIRCVRVESILPVVRVLLAVPAVRVVPTWASATVMMVASIGAGLRVGRVMRIAPGRVRLRIGGVMRNGRMVTPGTDDPLSGISRLLPIRPVVPEGGL